MARIVITGTSKGIGYDTILLLARAGHEVVATMRNPGVSDLEKVAREAHLPVTVLPLDVGDDASVAETFQKVGDSIDVLVNNAGILSINVVEDESLDQFQRVMQTNDVGAVRCTKRVLPAMRKRASGGGEMIRHVIESDDPRLRFPVGPDALPFLGWRACLSDQDWVALGGLQRDADYFERVFMDTGVDLGSK